MTVQMDRSVSRNGGDWVERRPDPKQRSAEYQARRDGVLRLLLGLVLPVGVLVAWEISARSGWIDARFFSQPTAVAAKAREDLASGLLWSELKITIFRLLTGYVIGSLAGILIGLLMSQVKVLRWMLEPLIRALYVIPKLALLPLFLLLFGLGEVPKLVFISLGTFYIVAFTTLSAAMMIPTAFHEVSRSYGLSPGQRFRWMIVPAITPQIVSSLKLASGISMLLVIAVEFVNAHEGLGYYTWHAWQIFVPDRMYVGVVTISIVGVLFGGLVGLLGSRVARWADSEYAQSR
ncbi:ABC transporter permease [Actinomadura sp. WMMB 499]|uniref:ABC transporter permease n=1 Tax=Actinomadura sp. WMMB 499 TaxID=1219491 RepID=UPI0012463EA3|nr:ABC transporter permease [Actinomadura sp. WMMB 499]QFG21335.1 ABC transporter permease [Actinomadura sp. WMMB 499]